VNQNLFWKVRRRAKDRCEYCRLPARFYPLPFHFDHIIASQHGGRTSFGNLALACLHCNRHKGPNIAGSDPSSPEGEGAIVRLFHPRRDVWREHFEWAGARLAGRTSIGRATIRVLAINDPDFLAVREALIEEQVFPFK